MKWIEGTIGELEQGAARLRRAEIKGEQVCVLANVKQNTSCPGWSFMEKNVAASLERRVSSDTKLCVHDFHSH